MDVNLKLKKQPEEDESSRKDATSPTSNYSWGSRAGTSFVWPEEDGQKQAAVEEADPSQENPFRMPTDDEVFSLRDQERKRRLAEREKVKNLKVWEKSTKAAGTSSHRIFTEEEIKALEEELADKDKRKDDPSGARRDRRREKENMSDFIAKKREMFLVQMSLDTKRAEIKKLEERAQQREEALKKSEQLLEEDALKFDAFLKENDMKAVEAIKNAEAQTKLKTEKLQEIKKLNMTIAQIKSDMSKDQEALEDCTKYKKFLEELTDPQWKEEQLTLARQRKEERKAKKRAEREAELAGQGQQEEGDEVKAKDLKKKKDDRRSRKKPAEKAKVQQQEQQKAIDDVSSSEDEEIPMYFTEPQQLLDKFLALEENNLFLIQNGQETEEQLEELRAKYKATKEMMDQEAEALTEQIDELDTAIKAEEVKLRALTERANEKAGAEEREKQEKLLDELQEKIADVYIRCGFDNSSNISALQMLTNIETRLEELLIGIEQMDPEEFKAAEKARDKERRQRLRAEKLEQQRKAQEQKIQRSLKRAQAPVVKKTGKPLMFRSLPMQKKKKDVEQATQKVDENEDIKRFFT